MPEQFKDRHQAGQILAKRLEHYARRNDVIILALPRGGVPVGFEIAQALDAPLDVFMVRKLGVPGHEELAMGAIASGGVRVLNERIIKGLRIPTKWVDEVAQVEQAELERRAQSYRGNQTPPEIAHKVAILVDDGLATGATMRAAAQAVRQFHPARIVVAVPVASAESCAEFENEVDEVICAKTPEDFRSVGAWYLDFNPTTDRQVTELLASARDDSAKPHFNVR